MIKKKANSKKKNTEKGFNQEMAIEPGITKRKSEINGTSSFDLHRLTKNKPWFIFCEIKVEGELYHFDFKTEGLKRYSELKFNDLMNRYQALINYSTLEHALEEYSFDLSPDNVFIDEYVMPKVRMRDAKGNIQGDDLFLKAYKSMIGYLLGEEEYLFNDYFNGGESLLKKSDKTAPFLSCNSSEEVKQLLISEMTSYGLKDREKNIKVSRRKFNMFKTGSIVLGTILVLFVAAILYFGIFIFKDNYHTLKGTDYYIQKNYINALKEFRNTNPERLNNGAKYAYAVSFVNLDANTSENRNALLKKLSPSTSSQSVYDFWIALARGEYTAAEEKAQAINDSSLLYYAYVKERDTLTENSKLSDKDKEKRREELDNKIDEIARKANELKKETEKTKRKSSKNSTVIGGFDD